MRGRVLITGKGGPTPTALAPRVAIRLGIAAGMHLASPPRLFSNSQPPRRGWGPGVGKTGMGKIFVYRIPVFFPSILI